MPDRRDDKFDEVRRAWIARHQGWSMIQRRRAEMLGRKVRARQRELAAAVPDPHDDTLIPPLWLRTTKSPASQVELLAVSVAVLAAPVGWLAGFVLKRVVTQLVPGTLRAYPIAMLLWSGAALGLVIVLLYDPAPTLGQTVMMPWICLQVAAAPVVAGIYGIVEGWPAVSGSDRWWPLTPPKRAVTPEDAALILGPDDTTGPGLIDPHPLPRHGERSQPW
ncbi:hypothetical protein [Mycobacterium branderi]|uniref:DUF2637 domain-containing protein n=1 Tax=Mycobacterium branderi TaxID=43348 RepID=A0A7I7WI42_9MYCO|nr:hypothetical protein [Mycobacterium branderi]MCV7231817.1 hypothetical protein [Mycobacterium branderi]ORA40230.1 hypothetical protein BST20_06625 [Mycobacterium branderi]BBZ15528.1 hypothetical protein MBRA_57230 [Mycobacterium branderi]